MEQRHLRAADADRQRVVDELQRNYVDGRLSHDELDRRVTLALAAQTIGDLDELLRDLPAGQGPAAAETTSHARPRHGPWASPEFRKHALTYVAVMALLVAIWLVTSPGRYFWPIWPMLGWGFAVVLHGLASVGWLGSGDDRDRSGPAEGDRAD